MFSTRAGRAIGAAAALAVGVALLAIAIGGSAEVSAATRPNIVVILSDDQFNTTTNAMPYVRSRDDWVEFQSTMVNTALCCPSRATLLTGLTSDHTGIESNSETALFKDQPTVAEWLDDAGYQTGFTGKYLNKFPWGEDDDYVPKGWDYWVSYSGKQGYHDYTLNENGKLVTPDRADDYSTDVFADAAVDFIGSTKPGKPFFSFVSFFGPHSPWTPPKRYQDTKVKKIRETPAFREKDVSDKPEWIRKMPRPRLRKMRENRIRHQQALLAIDDGIGAIFEALEEKGVLDETIVMYSTDHGISMGEHRYNHKTCGYEVCSRVPLLIRAPGVEGRTEPALVGNIDFTPTFADYAGIKTGEPVDGRSLRPIIEGERKRLHKGVYLHRAQGKKLRIFSGLRTSRWKYINYDKTGEQELYDLRRDPNELFNLISTDRAKWERKADELRDQMARIRNTPPRIR
ncbi:MAG: sulfatase [Solirubrobacterales bacterium]